jgi:pimeloyl-ACP methyl ester carboxylesterase/DNA-binding SARP family transcriptional activator
MQGNVDQLASSSNGRVSIDVLGPLRLVVDGRTIGPRDLGGRKPKQVLEVLLVHAGQPVPKDRIVDLVWGGRPPADPMRTLEAYVSVLRGRTAAELVRSEPRAYRVALEEADFDAWTFDDLAARAATAPPADRLALREQAAALVRGELLADEPYADWATSLRDLYSERYLGLVLDLAEDCLALGRPEAAAGHAERVLAAQPARERAHRLLMSARYALGEQDLALQAYERCRRVLDEELGVRPLPETERVFLAVLGQAPVPAVIPAARAPATAAPRPPTTRVARSGEATIAYQVLGDGPVDLVFSHGWFSHIEVGWEESRSSEFLHRLARDRRLILFDRRGMGMSDPAPPTVGLAERAGDIQAVMDAVASRRAVVFATCGAGPAAMSLAASAPERVDGLILFGTFARLLEAPDYPAGWTPAFLGEFIDGLEQGWTTGRGIARSVPSAGSDEALMEWLSRLLRLSVSPAAARAIMDFAATIDVRHLLGDIAAPTLVLHRRDDQWISVECGRHLAANIPGARLMELDGADHWPWFGDGESVLSAVEEFLGERRVEGFPRVAAAR